MRPSGKLVPMAPRRWILALLACAPVVLYGAKRAHLLPRRVSLSRLTRRLARGRAAAAPSAAALDPGAFVAGAVAGAAAAPPVAGAPFPVAVGGPAALFPSSQILPSLRTSPRTFKVHAEGGWTATSQAHWIATTSSGGGDGVVTYTVAPNAGAAPRTGTIQVAGRTFTVFQDGSERLVHPRLWVNPADVERLRGWATDANPAWKHGLGAALAAAAKYADAHWSWDTGRPDTVFRTPYAGDAGVVSGWRDDGGTNWQADATEAYAEAFAFGSLVAPDAARREAYARRARAMLLWIVRNANTGAGAHGAFPYGGKAFAGYNRANYWGEALGLACDWLYPVLGADDKNQIRDAFLMWNDDLLEVSTAGEEHPQPIAVENDPSLFADPLQLRWAANNYYIGHFRNLLLRGLAVDPVDDPAVKGRTRYPTVRSFVHNATGAWLYQIWSVFTDGAEVSAALGGARNPSFGVASGGMPVEGSLYGESQGYLAQALWALHTTGSDDPLLIGRQAALASSAYWDRAWQAFVHNTTPVPRVLSGLAYLGSVYTLASYGDTLRAWLTGDGVQIVAPIGIRRALDGDLRTAEATRFIVTHLLQGGAPQLEHRMSSVWGNSNAIDSILYFLLLDPARAAAADPRPSLPSTFRDATLARVVARTGWDAQARLFTWLCNWQTINHQQGAAGQFELYRKGEWLVKEWSAYGNDMRAYLATYHNTLSIENDPPRHLEWFEGPTAEMGGQWSNATDAGDATTRTSDGAGWTYAFGDTTNLYNRRDGNANDVLHASRSIVWLAPDHVVVYDRASTRKSGRFKRFNLVLTAPPRIVEDAATHRWRATVTTPGGQTLFVQHLLPAGATMIEQHRWKKERGEELDRVAEGEEAGYRLLVEVPGRPATARFLHVLQGADAGGAQTPVEAVPDTSGGAWDIAIVGRTAVAFPVEVGAGAAGVTYRVPAAVAGHLVTGLTPGAAYDVRRTVADGMVTLGVVPGAHEKADAAGVIAVGTIAP
jgi:hypothetical protein